MQTLLFQRKNHFAEWHEQSLTTILKTLCVSDSTLNTASPCKRTDQSYASSHYRHLGKYTSQYDKGQLSYTRTTLNIVFQRRRTGMN